MSDIATCPFCNGRGYHDTEENQSGRTRTVGTPLKVPTVPLCPLCHGAKTLDRDRICACGSPAVYTVAVAKTEIHYCGRDACKAAQGYNT